MPNDQIRNSFSNKTLWDRIIIQKLSEPIVVIFLVLASLSISFIVAREGYVMGVVILCAIIALPMAYAIVVYPKFGIITLIIVSFFINLSSRFLPEPTPIGLVMDALTYLLILGFFIKNKTDKQWAYFKNPITYFILAWIGYNFFEIINPSSPSVLEWVFTIRTMGFIMLMYFVFLYHIRTREFIKLLIKLWLILEIIGAISGFQQEHFGLFGFENEAI